MVGHYHEFFAEGHRFERDLEYVADSGAMRDKMVEDKSGINGEEALVEQKRSVEPSKAQVRRYMDHTLISAWQERCKRRDKIGQHVMILNLANPKNIGPGHAFHLLDDLGKLVEFFLVSDEGDSPVRTNHQHSKKLQNFLASRSSF